MNEDIRETTLYQEAKALHEAIRQPGAAQITDAAEISVSPDGRQAVFTGTIVEALNGNLPTHICHISLVSGHLRVMTCGPNVDRLPKYAPDGQQVAFLSDRHKAGDFQLYFLDPITGTTRPTPVVEGWVECLRWSPDGRRILLGVAGHGADLAGVQGAAPSRKGGVEEAPPSWLPVVDAGDEKYRWRRAWVYELATDSVRQVSSEDCNIWEVAWCGNDTLVAVVSCGPEEGHWYTAHLALIDIATGNAREIYNSQDQIGWPAASPSGKHLAVVEAVCSDRWFVAGDLRVIAASSGQVLRVDTRGVDITYTEWRSDQKLLLAGHRGFETVVGVYDVASNTFSELWASPDLTTGGFYASVSGYNNSGDCVLVGESFVRAPEIAVIREGTYQAVKSFELSHTHYAVAAVERLRWPAPDGLEIQGWLLCPKGKPPFPVVMIIHGGPVFHWRPRWLGRASAHVIMLLKRRYAVFLPNPRGSSGRGQSFARRVLGDLGGAETLDHLAGLDYLVNRGIVDSKRIGVMGLSHGGFMTSWLITRDSRFAAAVSVAPHTNAVTFRLISNVPQFVDLFLGDKYDNAGGRYFGRSPIMHAAKVKTPTLNICGALDRCTPPEEAVQFHNALRENGVKSVLVTYPEEGHGVRRFPAAIDYTARVVWWFEGNMKTAHSKGDAQGLWIRPEPCRIRASHTGSQERHK